MEATMEDKDSQLIAIQKLNKLLQEKVLSMECKMMEPYLRFRIVLDTKNENIYKKVVELIANFIGGDQDEIEYNFEDVYRVNSLVAEQKGLPRDIVVKMVSKKLKFNFV